MKVLSYLVAIVAGVVIGLTGFMIVEGARLNQTPRLVDGWDTYVSADGEFQFQKPEDVVVHCNDGSCILTMPTPGNEQPVPDMTVSVQEGEVIFRTWENFEIPYFERLVSSFEFVE